MNKSQWYENMLLSNTSFKLYLQANRSHLILDTSSILQVLDMHSEFQDISHNPNGGYYYIKIEEEKIWILILPGYTIFINIKNNIYKLFIDISEKENKIIFSWIDFGKDSSLSNIVVSNVKSDKFQSFMEYINLHGKISILNLLDINILDISKMLTMTVYEKYSHLYPNLQPIYKFQQKTEKIMKIIQKKAKRLRQELENKLSNTLIREELIITMGKTKQISYNEFMVTKQLLYNANRRIKRFKEKLKKFNKMDNEDDNNNYEEPVETYINNIIEESNLVSTVGFSVRIIITCKFCETSNEFINESFRTNFNKCFATAELVGGTNRRLLQIVMVGVIRIESGI
ncbi:hypothetical protein Glove_366g3 [Diversispora epigaea]|uniref:Uncharacterized protein n=1 Tax=Diversispora epigaea TaxID=1348612 RepID=A0A397HC39_9GLOM|nr:hypothetical protein Glove_366g3 [Diversispora epigaea]